MNLPAVVLSTTKLKGNTFNIRVVVAFIATTSIYEHFTRPDSKRFPHAHTHL